MEFLFLCFPMPIDNNTWYAKVGIFNCLIRYVSSTVRSCRDITFFINLLNKTKSYLALFLSFFIFCFGVTVLFLFIYFSLALFLYQNRFSSYTCNETSFLVSLHCLSRKSSLNYSVSCRFSLLTYIKPFICTSYIWNEILLIRSGDVELNPGPKNHLRWHFFTGILMELQLMTSQKCLWCSLMHCCITLTSYFYPKRF